MPGGEVSRALNQLISCAAPVRISAGFAGQTSDHDPLVACISPPR